MKNEHAEKWVGQNCFLDGKPAKVVGRLLDFAKIVSLDGKMSVEYSWDTVNRVMLKDKRFAS